MLSEGLRESYSMVRFTHHLKPQRHAMLCFSGKLSFPWQLALVQRDGLKVRKLPAPVLPFTQRPWEGYLPFPEFELILSVD